MSAQTIYDNAPLGAIVRFSDGTKRPPERFNKKLSAWQQKNDTGRLVRKSPESVIGNHTSPAGFTLQTGDITSGAVVLVKVFRSFSTESPLRFEVTELPSIGSVRVLNIGPSETELLHLATDREAAEAWMKSSGYRDAVFEEVTADELAALQVEGRAA